MRARLTLLAVVVVALALPFQLGTSALTTATFVVIAAIGATGLNILTGYAGQISLGHAFFLAVGAYTGAKLGADHGWSAALWIPAAGVIAGLCGALVGPVALRLRGLYLAIVTLGLVFLSEHIFKEWDSLTGGPGVGRPAAVPELFGVRLHEAGAFTKEQKLFWLMLVMLVLFAVLARNLVRSRIGRAFAAVRDRDIAAEVIGVDLRRYKLLAFAISSFYAGVAGALMYTVAGFFDPGSFNLLLSMQFIAMVLIGGAATISGSIMGAMFITLLPRLTRELPAVLPFISTESQESPNVFQVETVLYGLLIVFFLILEPRGLFGIWTRVRNYWKAWPFSY
jgi:branched-chain amino acid transport system permease protein